MICFVSLDREFVVFDSADNSKARLLQSEREASTSRKQIDRCRLSHAGQILRALSIDVKQCQTRALFSEVLIASSQFGLSVDKAKKATAYIHL